MMLHIVSFLGSGPVGDNDLWLYHIEDFSPLSFSFFAPSRAFQAPISSHLPLRLSQLALRPSQLALGPYQLAPGP